MLHKSFLAECLFRSWVHSFSSIFSYSALFCESCANWAVAFWLTELMCSSRAFKIFWKNIFIIIIFFKFKPSRFQIKPAEPNLKKAYQATIVNELRLLESFLLLELFLFFSVEINYFYTLLIDEATFFNLKFFIGLNTKKRDIKSSWSYNRTFRIENKTMWIFLTKHSIKSQ